MPPKLIEPTRLSLQQFHHQVPEHSSPNQDTSLPTFPAITIDPFSQLTYYDSKMPTSITTIRLMLDTGIKEVQLGSVDEQRIREHSKTIRTALDNRPSDDKERKVVVFGAAPAALDFVIQRVKGWAPSGSLHIKVHNMPLLRAVAVYEACKALDLEPAQPHVEGHVAGHLAHNTITPDEMMATALASRRYRETDKVYNTLVQQVAWGLVHAKYSEKDAAALQNEAEQWTELHDELDAKVQELKVKRERYDAL